MTEEELAITWLDSFDFLTYKKKQKIVESFKNICDVFCYDKIKDNKQLLNIIESEENFEILKNQCLSKSFNNVEKSLQELNIQVITVFSKIYPQNLKNIDTPPFVLYCKGNVGLLSTSGFAVVGTRHITNYGKEVTERFVKDLVQAGFTIVSGLASGVDFVAHSTTLKNNGKTIAVLAGGLDEIYPKSNTNLANDIIKNGGLLVSETRPYKKTDAYMFPIRNRIIAALSRGVLVTEAQEKSGVIHTKNYALEYGKDMFSVPGNIFSLTSVGANRMIVNGQAKAVICPQDILDEYNIKLKQTKQKLEKFSFEETIVINQLKKGQSTFQQLVDTTNFDAKTLNSLLTTLLIRGIIKKLAGNVYMLF